MSSGYVYPAFLSHIAIAFRQRVPLATHIRDGVEYQRCFLGSEAVDTIAFIISSTDRNLALVLGRCLDSQGFIFDVAFSNQRLRDTADLLAPSTNDLLLLTLNRGGVLTEIPGGVFTLLADCFAPTCALDALCYSVSCPRRLFQAQRLAKKCASECDLLEGVASAKADDLWWSNTVPKDVLESVSKEEEKRQNAIYDIIKTEKNYVEELRIIQSLYAGPLRESNVIETSRLDTFAKVVFCNAADLLTVNQKILAKLLARQKEAFIVEKIGDVFLACASELHVYVEYCGNREYSRNDIALEKAQNPKFKEFLANAHVGSGIRAEIKHELDGYLHKPIARMASYLLLLRAILEKTPSDHPDKVLIPQAVKAIEEVLGKMNAASGKTMTKIKLMQLNQQIYMGDHDLQLLDPEREIIYEGKLVLKRPTGDLSLVVFLFDNYLVMTRKIIDKKVDLSKRPSRIQTQTHRNVPLPNKPHPSFQHSTATAAAAAAAAAAASAASTNPENRLQFSITVVGRETGGTYTFQVETESGRNIWREHIMKLRSKKLLGNVVFDMAQRLFSCCCDVGGRLVLATEAGLFVGPKGSLLEPEEYSDKFVQVLELEKITQVDVVLEHGLLLVLADKTMYSFNTSLLDTQNEETRKHKKIGDAINFFQVGNANNRTLVCTVRAAQLSSTIKIFESVEFSSMKRKGRMNLFSRDKDAMKLFKEFYIPTEASSIHILKTKLVVGCTKGFEIVDLDTLETQALLDPSDDSLDFVLVREDTKPTTIFKVSTDEYFLCYDDFGFFVDRSGRRARPDFLLKWAGNPTSFAYLSPYILAFDTTFICIRNLETGDIAQVVYANCIKCIHVDVERKIVLGASGEDRQSLFRLKMLDSGRFAEELEEGDQGQGQQLEEEEEEVIDVKSQESNIGGGGGGGVVVSGTDVAVVVV
ncbi:CNH domain-containing protein [Obelidium mucronatum]|nr:CNH domain-containing protein [Obelidium mucronatum]